MGMTHRFDDDVVSAVLGHMNTDHAADNVLIVRAFGDAPEAVSASMRDFDGDAGAWAVSNRTGEEILVRVPWPGGPIAERREVRREIVALYDEACHRLGQTPRPHEPVT
jgi:Protein of unknown function (DUF2470)